jgi:hypothetical protein
LNGNRFCSVFLYQWLPQGCCRSRRRPCMASGSLGHERSIEISSIIDCVTKFWR